MIIDVNLIWSMLVYIELYSVHLHVLNSVGTIGLAYFRKQLVFVTVAFRTSFFIEHMGVVNYLIICTSGVIHYCWTCHVGKESCHCKNDALQ